jgi:hypothetical protein
MSIPNSVLLASEASPVDWLPVPCRACCTTPHFILPFCRAGSCSLRPCDNIRKEWRQMTSAEKNLYFRAVGALSSSSRYDSTLSIHWAMPPATDRYAHQSAGIYPVCVGPMLRCSRVWRMARVAKKQRAHCVEKKHCRWLADGSNPAPPLPHWHRYYLYNYEEALRASGPEFRCVTIPYYDWSADGSGFINASPLSEFGGRTSYVVMQQCTRFLISSLISRLSAAAHVHARCANGSVSSHAGASVPCRAFNSATADASRARLALPSRSRARLPCTTPFFQGPLAPCTACWARPTTRSTTTSVASWRLCRALGYVSAQPVTLFVPQSHFITSRCSKCIGLSTVRQLPPCGPCVVTAC